MSATKIITISKKITSTGWRANPAEAPAIIKVLVYAADIIFTVFKWFFKILGWVLQNSEFAEEPKSTKIKARGDGKVYKCNGDYVKNGELYFRDGTYNCGAGGG